MKITFENATIADAIDKAARVAPTKGTNFDKCYGLLLTVDEDGTVNLRATNLEVFYHEVVDAVDTDGGPGEWRLPSVLASGFFGKLPIGSGKQVVMEQKGTAVECKSGRTTARLRLSDATYYPRWDPFDTADLENVPDLGARLQQVAWCADGGSTGPWSAVYLDGEVIAASDSVRIAMVPCVAPILSEPIAVPASVFAPVQRSLRDVAIGVGDAELYLMPDPQTQIRATMLAETYPPVRKVFDARGRSQPDSIKFNKPDLLGMIERATVFAGNDRMPLLKLFIGAEEVAVMMNDTEENLLGDIIDVSGQAIHKRVVILVTPKNLSEAVTNAPSNKCELFYDRDNPMSPLRVDGGSGYEVLVMPRKENKTGGNDEGARKE